MKVVLTEILNNSIILRQVCEIPLTIKGFSSLDLDGLYNVYINYNLPMNEKYATFNHEMRHINNDDFYNDNSIYEIEG